MKLALAPAYGVQLHNGGIAPVGGLGWTPDTFWNATLTEFHRAFALISSAGKTRTDMTPIKARAVARLAGYKIFGESK